MKIISLTNDALLDYALKLNENLNFFNLKNEHIIYTVSKKSFKKLTEEKINTRFLNIKGIDNKLKISDKKFNDLTNLKFKIVKENLNVYNSILFLDVDIFINNFFKDFFFNLELDAYFQNDFWYNEINTGCFYLKNNYRVHNFLDNCIHFYRSNRSNKNKFPLELLTDQKVANFVIKKAKIKWDYLPKYKFLVGKMWNYLEKNNKKNYFLYHANNVNNKKKKLNTLYSSLLNDTSLNKSFKADMKQ